LESITVCSLFEAPRSAIQFKRNIPTFSLSVIYIYPHFPVAACGLVLLTETGCRT